MCEGKPNASQRYCRADVDLFLFSFRSEQPEARMDSSGSLLCMLDNARGVRSAVIGLSGRQDWGW